MYRYVGSYTGTTFCCERGHRVTTCDQLKGVVWPRVVNGVWIKPALQVVILCCKILPVPVILFGDWHYTGISLKSSNTPRHHTSYWVPDILQHWAAHIWTRNRPPDRITSGRRCLPGIPFSCLHFISFWPEWSLCSRVVVLQPHAGR